MMKALPQFGRKFWTILLLVALSASGLVAQHDLSVMGGIDYGIPINSYQQGRNVLYGKLPSRQFDMNVGLRYRMFDRIGIEGGVGQSIRTMRMGDNRFEDDAPRFGAVIRSKNHYLSAFVGLQGYIPLSDGDFFVVGGGMMWNNAGGDSLTASATYVKGNETMTINNAYMGSNRSYYGEVGYMGAQAGRSTLYIGAKVNVGEDLLMRGHYAASDNTTGTTYTDAVTDKGSYVGLVLKYYFRVLRKEKVEKDRHAKRLHRRKQPDPVEHPTKPVEPVMQLEGRDVKIDNNIKAMNREITINVWDSQAQDGDTISVYLNGEVLLSNVALKNQKTQFKAQLQPGKNYLVLYAHNLGKYPPNTAAIIVDDGVKQHQVVVESTLKTSGSVEITLGQ